ncbi:MAG: hypothetical protein OEZ43_08365 [Gammaproteobacteria bacterium]|nr:hypothetical protein [Gammaproteobacteria bacterium]
MRKLGFLPMLMVFVLLPINVAHAYNFIVTEAEYSSWSVECQGMYAFTQIGKMQGYARNYSAADIERWRVFGERNGGAWHYCAGKVLLTRASLELDAQKRKKFLERAVNETGFSYGGMKDGAEWASEIAATYATALAKVGRDSEAEKIFEKAIQLQPRNSVGYLQAYLYYKNGGKDKFALDILLKGDEAMQKKSSEIAYFLGLYYVDKGEVSIAEEYAERAYSLGYPLQGLRNKLAEKKDKGK